MLEANLRLRFEVQKNRLLVKNNSKKNPTCQQLHCQGTALELQGHSLVPEESCGCLRATDRVHFQGSHCGRASRGSSLQKSVSYCEIKWKMGD